MKALILNSGVGSRMGILTSEHPKCMTEVSSQETILSRQLRMLSEVGIRQAVITTGPFAGTLMDYCHSLELPIEITFVNNPDYRKSNYIYSIYLAREYLDGDILLMHGDLVCTYCEKDVPIKGKPRHNKTARCSCCRHEITYKAIGKLGWRLDTEEVCVYLIQPRADGFVVREFWAGKRYLKKDLKSPERYCVEHWRTIYDADLKRRLYYWGLYKQLSMRWIAGIPAYSWMGANSIYNSHGDKPGRVYGKTLPRLKPILKKTGLLDWIYGHRMVVNPDAYFTVCNQLPQFEQIWKAGLSRLAGECEHNPGCMHGLIKEPKSTSLTKALGLDKQGLERLRRNDGDTDFLRWLQAEKKSGKPISGEVLIWFCEQKISRSDLRFIWSKMTAVQIYNFLRRQAETSQESVQQVLTTWQDYLSMAERLGIDTNDEIIYRVKLLRQRHDELVLRCKQMDKKGQAAEVLKRFPKVDRICQSIKAKYEYANEKLSGGGM